MVLFRFFCLTLLSFAPVVFAEVLGDLRIEDLTLRPQAYFQETQKGGFELGESSVALGWYFDQTFSSQFRIGSHSEIVQPKFYLDPKNPQELDLVEAYAQVQGILGQLRFGLIPLGLSSDAQRPAYDLIFPRGYIYSEGLFGLRDIGASYTVSYNHFFTSVTIHNGEGKSDVDNQAWYSATWGYDFYKLRLAAFGQTGSTKPTSTSTSTLTVADFNPNQDAKWRMGGVFAHWTPSRFEMTLEGVVGDKEQEQSKRRYISGHLDFGQIGEKGFGMYFRYNLFDPDLEVSNDGQHKVSLAFVWTNLLHNSKLILIGSKVMEEQKQIPNDEVRLVWNLTPQQ